MFWFARRFDPDEILLGARRTTQPVTPVDVSYRFSVPFY
jgi:hypothetical protein